MRQSVTLRAAMLTAIMLAAATTANAYSQYLSDVYEYCPAPGQFVNTLPAYTNGDDVVSMAQKCTDLIGNNAKGVVSLGGFGGYIVFGFDHPVVNHDAEADFIISGNAFYTNDNPNPDAPAEGGSCEPGIVMVSRDTNGNGLPDDEWYELAGSEYSSAATRRNYTITYYRPDPTATPTPDPDDDAITDTRYIRWIDSEGNTGYVERNEFHDQSYWPEWLDQERLTFTGTRLADNAVDESDEGSTYVLYAYPWGYVDNHPNRDERNRFDIAWAVDANGDHVDLPYIDFIKVYTAVNQKCGWLGETSTEVCGAQDLHLYTGIVASALAVGAKLQYDGQKLCCMGLSAGTHVTVTSVSGTVAAQMRTSSSGTEYHRLVLAPGIYIVTAAGAAPLKISAR